MGLYIAAIMVSKISIIFCTIKNPVDYNITVTLQPHDEV
jgi:predicted SpoU family rRNA methylase